MPLAWKSRGNVVPPIHKPLDYIFNERVWVRDELEQIGKAMQAWRGAGCINNVTVGRLKSYLVQKPKAPGSGWSQKLE